MKKQLLSSLLGRAFAVALALVLSLVVCTSSKAEDFELLLPFAGSAKIFQANFSDITHNTPEGRSQFAGDIFKWWDSSYCIDFQQLDGGEGQHVLAAADGTVVAYGPDNKGMMGRHVAIYHPKGNITTVYAHLKTIAVHLGDAVRAGEVIGELGAAVLGRDNYFSPPHLHFFILGTEGVMNYGAGMIVPSTPIAVQSVEPGWYNGEVTLSKVNAPNHGLAAGDTFYFTGDIADVYGPSAQYTVGYVENENLFWCSTIYTANFAGKTGGLLYESIAPGYIDSQPFQKLIMQIDGEDTEPAIYGEQGKSLLSAGLEGKIAISTNVERSGAEDFELLLPFANTDPPTKISQGNLSNWTHNTPEGRAMFGGEGTVWADAFKWWDSSYCIDFEQLDEGEGQDVLASAAGTVVAYGPDTNGIMGRHIAIYHPEGNITTVYAHLKTTAVRLMDTVEAGDVIGTLGMCVFGTCDYPSTPHLHFFILGPGGIMNYGEGFNVPSTPITVESVEPGWFGYSMVNAPNHGLAPFDTFYFTGDIAGVYGVAKFTAWEVENENRFWCSAEYTPDFAGLTGGLIYDSLTPGYVNSQPFQKLIMQIDGEDTEPAIYGEQGKSLLSADIDGKIATSTNIKRQ